MALSPPFLGVHLGYDSCLHLINVKIKPAAVPTVERALSNSTKGPAKIRWCLDLMLIDGDGFLSFRTSGNGTDAYVPDEEDGTVRAQYGKWYKAELLARWLRRYSEGGGRIVLHSIEGDGEAWGWEFDGRGRMRALSLGPHGKWE